MTDRYTQGWCDALDMVTPTVRRLQARLDRATSEVAQLEADLMDARADKAEAEHRLAESHKAWRTGARA